MTKHVYIEGKVQGVYFRDSTREQALKLGITGWVRNLPDGRVEAVFQGEEDKLKKMLEWCWQGSPMSRVDDVYVEDMAGKQEFSDFLITG
jgi:acylphosphatase